MVASQLEYRELVSYNRVKKDITVYFLCPRCGETKEQDCKKTFDNYVWDGYIICEECRAERRFIDEDRPE